MDTPPLRFWEDGGVPGRIAEGQTALYKSDALIMDIDGESKALKITIPYHTYPPRGGGGELL